MSYPVFYPVVDDTLIIPWGTYDGGTGASITMTGLATSDIEIYKDGGMTQRSSDAGYTLLDTDGIDLDSITGIQGISIDLSNNSDAGFYAAGSQYFVVVSSVTVDGQTVNFVAGWFEIRSTTRGLGGTALPDAAAGAAGGLPTDSTGKTSFNDLSAAQVNTEADTAISDAALATAASLSTVDTVVDGIQLDLDNGIDGLGAIAALINGLNDIAATDVWAAATRTLTANTNFNDLDAAGVRSAVGLAAADLDTQIATLATAAALATVDTVVDGIQTDLDNGVDGLGALKTLIDALNDISAADVNAQVLDVMNTDTFAEPGQAAPPATASLVNKIGYLYKNWRNKKEQTSSTFSLYDDAGTTVDQKATVSDAAGTSTKEEIGSGP